MWRGKRRGVSECGGVSEGIEEGKKRGKFECEIYKVERRRK